MQECDHRIGAEKRINCRQRAKSAIKTIPRLVANLSLLHNTIHIVSRFKENFVPNDSAESKIPEEAMNAFLDGILSELASPSDPAMLTRVRAIFRKRIPLHLRSLAAAILIMRAAGLTRATPSVPGKQPSPVKQSPPGKQSPQAKQSLPQKQTPLAKEPAIERKRSQVAKNADATVPLFVSMGKRQRLRPQELRVFISEKTGIACEELGRVHLFDNYSFIDVQESHAEKVIKASDGLSFKGRSLEIKPAKKRSELPQEKDLNE
jgi:hypothetical protein